MDGIGDLHWLHDVIYVHLVKTRALALLSAMRVIWGNMEVSLEHACPVNMGCTKMSVAKKLASLAPRVDWPTTRAQPVQKQVTRLPNHVEMMAAGSSMIQRMNRASGSVKIVRVVLIARLFQKKCPLAWHQKLHIALCRGMLYRSERALLLNRVWTRLGHPATLLMRYMNPVSDARRVMTTKPNFVANASQVLPDFRPVNYAKSALIHP
jgi:hypothetical protein